MRITRIDDLHCDSGPRHCTEIDEDAVRAHPPKARSAVARAGRLRYLHFVSSGFDNLRALARENLERFRSGQPLLNPVPSQLFTPAR